VTTCAYGVGRACSAVYLPLLDGDLPERLLRARRVVHRVRLAVLDLDSRLEELFLVLVGDQEDRLGRVADLPLREARLVVLDQGHDVLPGDVAVVRDGEAVRVGGPAGREGLAPPDRPAGRGPVGHPRG